jgi:ribosome assembly protein 1
MTFASMPIVRVAVEPENLSDMDKLYEGLKILNQSDPSVEVLVQETGEHVIVAAGELHLERCLRDLRELFAKVPIRVSPPIVAFRETVTNDPSTKFPANKEGVHTANHLGTIKVRAIPLPEEIRKLLEANAVLVRKIFVEESVDLKENADVIAFRDQLMQVFKAAGENWEKELQYLWSFGPRRIGPNILLNHIPKFSSSPNWEPLIKKIQADYQPKNTAAEGKVDKAKALDIPTTATELDTDDTAAKVLEEVETERLLKELNNSIVTGFQLATSAGPLCEEPISGVCFIIDDIVLREGDLDSRGPFTGQIISAVKEACRQAFLAKSVRLIQAMYFCYIQVPPEYMGKMFGVLGRRRAKILKEEQKEGTSIFSIEALLPVVESFGLSVELLTETSGSASTQLVFHGWETLDQDPYYVPATEEDLEEFGENVGGVARNIALEYMNAVRRRKGLFVEEQLVKHANKQRTRSKKK